VKEQIKDEFRIGSIIQNLLSNSVSSDLSNSEQDISENEQEIYDQLHAEDDELTSGYSTISSNISEFVRVKQKQSS
jgi:hypothetical protein